MVQIPGLVRILLVDQRPVMREGLAAVLGEEPNLRFVGYSTTAKQATAATAQLLPTVVIVGSRLGDITGFRLTTELVGACRSTRVLHFETRADDLAVDSAFEAGARGYVLETADVSVIRMAVQSVAMGEVFLDPRIAARRATFNGSRMAKGPWGLTRQELRVLDHLPRGLTNRAIGDSLNVSEDTVKTHLRGIFFKLKAHDRAEAVAIALRAGLL